LVRYDLVEKGNPFDSSEGRVGAVAPVRTVGMSGAVAGSDRARCCLG
jgi:hypothetical protein